MPVPEIESLPSSTHEAVFRWEDQRLGVVGFTAIHSTRLGPAFGGVRVWRYANEAEALSDALRLSEGMTYKNAVADLGAGGGKSVLWVRADSVDRDALFTAFGEVVQALDGRYVTAEDVGTSVADMETVRGRTPFVAGLPAAPGHAGGDPSPWTALGVFCGIEAALAVEGKALAEATVAVQGLGAVGEKLCRLLKEAGVQLIVSDRHVGRAQQVAEALGAKICDPEQILSAPADVLAPCALGGALNQTTIPRLAVKLIVGAANNQLASPQDGHDLALVGITYVPDFVANAGGIINAMAEFRGEHDRDVERDVRRIGERVSQLLQKARRLNLAPFELAEQLAHDLVRPSAMRVPA